MNKLWGLFAISLILAFVIQYRDKRMSTQNSNSNRGDKLFTLLLMLYLGIFCGLRIRYNDTSTYIHIFEQTPQLDELLVQDKPSFAHGIGFSVLNSAMKTLGFSSQDFLMFYAIATAVCYVLFVRKHAVNFLFSVFLMFTTGFYTFSFAAIKQCMATAICLLGLEHLLRGKILLFVLFVGIASLFHPYALVYLLLILMDYRPLTSKTYFHIAIFVIVGLSLGYFITPIVDITAMMGATYDVASFVGEGVNIFRVLVCFVPLVLSALCGRKIFEHSTRTDNILFNMCMLNALIMFVGLFGTANYFARLANYFLPAQVVVLPWILRKIGGKDGQILTFLCIVGFVGYFMYGNMVQHVFDEKFAQITLWKYIASHLGA